MTVPSNQLSTFKPTSICVARVTHLSGGSFWGYESKNGDDSDVQVGFALKFWRALKADNINLAMECMQAYLAGIPYVEGFKKKLAETATAGDCPQTD